MSTEPVLYLFAYCCNSPNENVFDINNKDNKDKIAIGMVP